MRKNDGFTLIEVLIALAVLAIALAAVIDKTIESGANISYLRERTLAHWVAENKLAEMQATDEWRQGKETGKSELAGREWQWQVEAIATPAPNLRRVVIRVFSGEDKSNSLATLHGFLLNPEVRNAGMNPAGDAPGGSR